ncbi:hypothetical protein SAMN05428975_3976 [Mucilaginibacter sp. OK268]|jgi:hypothetical protein|uniref:hypothetical protein n=1 Tax=Mucilaginibacter sp. OK268 TaxID=1881048 RepID=UPI00088E0206|nr:hypothetical protein [Mucilaginibacter sp. OK268]SDP94698.1 hypothetical protein SAMN05428975_3976 [Mucilaginibacter sp. OK268]
MIDISQIKKDRFRYLNYLYEQAGGSLNAVYDMEELGNELGFEYNLMRNVVDYLMNEGLIEPHGLGGTIRLSHKGVKEVEQANESPDEATEHFGPIITYNIHSSGEGNIVNMGNNNVFNLSQTFDRSAIKAQTQKIKDVLGDDIFIDEDKRNEALALLTLLLAEVQAGGPSKDTIGLLLRTGSNIPSIGSLVLSLFLLIYTL